MKFRTGLGQDSHRFDFENKTKKLVLGGVEIENSIPLKGNSDADVILHSLTNSISSITGVNILGPIADELCLKKNIKDSRVYLKEALKYLKPNFQITHISISVECKKPKLLDYIPKMKKSISKLFDIEEKDIGITVTTGEGLTEFGKGQGIQVFSIISGIEKDKK